MRKHSFPEMRKLLLGRCLILISCFCLIGIPAIGQNQQIHLQKKALTLKEAFGEIERQTDLSVDYDAQTVNVSRQASVPQTSMTVNEFLKAILQGTGYTHEIQGNHILIKSSNRQGTPKLVSGKIVDSKGEPVAGANILVVGKNIGTSSDANGEFSIAASDNDILDISFIGFVPERIHVNSKPVVDIVLKEDTKLLDEVVVIGYGTTKKEDFTGSVSTVRLADSPVALSSRTNIMDALRGTVTGLTTSREMSAGSTPSIEIHGQKSISSSSTPLIVLDGVIFLGGWRDIDPSTVESVSVLKDAASLAAYGSQAANGVIMITTKKGKIGKPVINFESSLTISKATLLPDYLSPEKFVEKTNIVFDVTDGNPQSWMKPSAYENYVNGKTTNWLDYVLRTGVLQKYNLSISGASEKTNYFVSLSNYTQKGIIYGDDYKRNSIMLRLQNDITDWLGFGTQINFTTNNYDGISAKLQPYLSPYGVKNRPNGDLEKYVMEEGSFAVNPLWETDKGKVVDDKERYSTTYLKGHTLIKCPWIEGLSYRINGVYSKETYRNDRFYHEGYYVTEGAPNDDTRYDEATIANYLSNASGYNTFRTNTYYVFDNILNYTIQKNKHFVDFTAVYTRDEYISDTRTINGSNFKSLGNTVLGYNGLSYAEVQTSDANKTEKTDIGYLARLIYNYSDKYHFSASVRRDGSSVFGSDKKWGIFPAFGAAWTISDESFMEAISFIDYLKINASWGKNGNQSLSPYGTLSKISLGQAGNHPYLFGNSGLPSWGQYVSSIGNTELGWETTTVLNLGMESHFIDERIQFEMNWYKSRTTDQIFSRLIPVMNSGFTSMKATMGQVNNWGIEFTLNTDNIVKKDFRWSSMLNFSLNRNKLVDLYGDDKDDISNSLFIGKSLGAIYGYKNIGIVQENNTDYINVNNTVAGEPKYQNVDGSEDGKITPSDRTILGYRKENFRMNMTQSVSYKNMELYMLFTGVFGGGNYGKETNTEAYLTYNGFINNLDHAWWTPENRSNKYPRPQANGSNYTPVMGYGFVRLQDVSLSYAFRNLTFKRVRVNNISVFLSAKNLFTITNWVGGDPEIRQKFENLSASYTYPLQRSYSFGFKISF